MSDLYWTFWTCGRRFLHWQFQICSMIRLTLVSLFYNDFADRYYVGDTCMEPMFWFVDHFTKILGPVCVTAVILLSCSLIIIAYVIGLPFYLKQNFFVLSLALMLGHWILINVVFYYYMAFTTQPGYPPQGAMITEAVSICKRCIAPKPARTHHCIVCNRCILKMDHHCPWLNNCVGHFNHRYFFMFGVHSWVGIVFLIAFGIPIAYEHFLGEATESRIASVVVNFITTIQGYFSISPFLIQDSNEDIQALNTVSNSTNEISKWPETLYHSCLVYGALLCVAVFIVLGGLLAWHARLISRGETSIEGHINKKESARLLKEGQIYKNPYDFGTVMNWKIFLSIGVERSWWYMLLPYTQEPLGDGLQWNILNNAKCMYIPKTKSKTCLVKLS